MENIDSILLPDLSDKKKTPPKKETKKIANARDRLPRLNREVKCAYCETIKILNPDQYQLLFDIHGSEDNISSSFMCKPCEMESRNNPIKFWSIHGDFWGPFSREAKEIMDAFNSSHKTQQDLTVLQQIIASKLQTLYVTSNFLILLDRDHTARGIRIENFPFIGNIDLKVYEHKKNKVSISS